MSRKLSSQIIIRRHSREEAAPRGPWALLLVDQAPLRKAVLADIEAARAELDELKRQWREYEEKDVPAFHLWMHRTFGAKLSELEELARRIHEKRVLIEAVHLEADRRGITLRAALRSILNHRDDEDEETVFGDLWDELESYQEEPEIEEEETPRGSGRSSSGSGTGAGQSSSQGSSKERGDRPAEPLRAGKLARVSEEVKRLYRALARKLHPDAQTRQDARVRALWLQVQEAYESGDLDHLVSLAALCDLDGGVVNLERTLGELHQAARELHRSARSLRADLRKAEREDPAWGFASGGNIKEARKRMRREIEDDLAEAQAALDELEQYLEKFS